MAKYPIVFQKGNIVLKRSIDVPQMEILFIVSSMMQVRKTKKKTGEIMFVFPNLEINSMATVKKLPLWIMRKFQPEKNWF